MGYDYKFICIFFFFFNSTVLVFCRVFKYDNYTPTHGPGRVFQYLVYLLLDRNILLMNQAPTGLFEI